MKTWNARFAAALAALSVLGLSADAQVIDKNYESGSLWSNQTNPLIDRTARRVGDLITIIISEQSIASFSASTDLKKEDSSKVNTSFVGKFLSGLFRPLSSASTGASSSNSGSGSTLQNGKLAARLTAVVKQVLPGGNLIIEGTRAVVVNKEIQTFKLSGVIRRDDVRPDNTVYSENIADADIRMEGKGAIYDRQRRGLLTRLLEWLF